MYGLIIDHIVTFIKEHYGQHVWIEVKYVSGVEQDVYQMDEVYSEGLAHKLIWATHDVTGHTVDDITNRMGKSFFRFLAKYEFHKIVRVLGRTFPQFLNGLDNLHEYLRFSFPKLKPPSFYCEHESRTGLTLHYRSKRRGFIHYVKGQIQNIAKELYHTELEIEMLDHEQDNSMEHVIMRLHFNNIHFSKSDNHFLNLTENLRCSLSITSDIFFDIFPFIVVFNRGMRIRNVGIGLLRVMSNLVGKKINSEFILMRPFIRFRWEEEYQIFCEKAVHNSKSFDDILGAAGIDAIFLTSKIMLHSNNIFELMSTEPIIEDDEELFAVYKQNDTQQMTEERHRMTDKEREKFLSLKGQMFYMEEWESICFMGTPVMSNLNQMYKSGLFINDFALHDSSRDLVLASTQQAAELKLLLHQESQKSYNMTENMHKLKKERKRADQFLYQLLPKSVATMLRNGESAVACCESFESVTVIFTDIVGFTNICSQMSPLEVVSFLNVVYTTFDSVVDTHGVYKVETIGDAYMVASGAPIRTEHDAEYALDCAASLIREVAKLDESNEDFKLEIRAGVHSGAVVAGVVGLKMPRYCMFGDTVQIANCMEQNSKPMQVLISETTMLKMENSDPGLFHFIDADNVEVKSGTIVSTYFLTGKTGVARIPTPTEMEEDKDDENSNITITEPVHGRTTPTAMAVHELQKRSRLSYTPVSDAEIESYSRNENRSARQEKQQSHANSLGVSP